MLPKVIVVLVIISAVLGGVFFFTGQSNNQTQSNKQSSQTELVKVSTTLAIATPSEPVLLLVRKLGLDKKNGLDIEIVDSNPGDAEREFFEGKFKIIYNGTLSSFTANLKNIPIRIIAPAIDQPFDVLVPVDSPIKTIEDLKGKKLATLPKITASYMSTTTIFRSAGIDPEKDMKITFSTPPQIVELLSTGEVDAGIGVAPSSYGLLSSGKFRSIANLEDLWESKEDGLHMPFVTFSVHEDWYQANKDVARRFVKTFYEASAMIQKDPNILLKELPEYMEKYKLNDPKTFEIVKAKYPRLLYTTYTPMGEDSLKRTYERAKEFGVIPNNVPAFDTVVISKQDSGI